MSADQAGIPSCPVLFENGLALPPLWEVSPAHPQNLWHSMETNQRWIAAFVLGLTTDQPYKEPVQTVPRISAVEEADQRRANDTMYTDRRNLVSVSWLFAGGNSEMVRQEFRGRSVAEIGSGAGVLSDDLRRQAGAWVTEIDFSESVMQDLPPIFEGRGSRQVADGTDLPNADGTYERTLSLFSTTLHTNTIRGRLRGLTEALRITQEGGRAFISPIIGGMVLRQQQWFAIQTHKHDPVFYDEYMQITEATLRQQAAIDFALTNVLRALIIAHKVSFTPTLLQEVKGKKVTDGINGIFDIQQTLTRPEANMLIEQAAAQFSN